MAVCQTFVASCPDICKEAGEREREVVVVFGGGWCAATSTRWIGAFILQSDPGGNEGNVWMFEFLWWSKEVGRWEETDVFGEDACFFFFFTIINIEMFPNTTDSKMWEKLLLFSFNAYQRNSRITTVFHSFIHYFIITSSNQTKSLSAIIKTHKCRWKQPWFSGPGSRKQDTGAAITSDWLSPHFWQRLWVSPPNPVWERHIFPDSEEDKVWNEVEK